MRIAVVLAALAIATPAFAQYAPVSGAERARLAAEKARQDSRQRRIEQEEKELRDLQVNALKGGRATIDPLTAPAPAPPVPNPLATRVGQMIAADDCQGAIKLALTEGDLDLAGRAKRFCAPSK
jgi:hypothetical protein